MDLETYRKDNDLTFEQLGDRLGISKGHASDLCKGHEPIRQKVAVKLEELTGRPWHEWMSPPNSEAAA